MKFSQSAATDASSDSFDLRNRLLPIRAALERYWAAWAVEKGRPDATSGATMCRFTAAFLVHVLGGQWFVVGGEPLVRGEAAGYFDGTSWHGHYWVTDGERIVDLTATQFGAEPVVITTVKDARYAMNYSHDELEDALANVSARAEQWADDFHERHGAAIA